MNQKTVAAIVRWIARLFGLGIILLFAVFLIGEGFLDKQIKSTVPITENIIKESISDVKHIVFEVTENCNLKCKYCIFGHLYTEKQSKDKNKDLNIELAKKIIDHVLNQVLTHPVPLFSISFGIKVILLERFIPLRFLDAVQKHKVTFFYLVPSMWTVRSKPLFSNT